MADFTLQALCMLFASMATFLLLYLLLRRRTSTESQRVTAPPSPPSLPIIGHLHLLSDMPHHSFAELARRLGPIFRLQLGRVNAVVISSARLAELVLKSHDHVFASRPQLLSARYLSFNCSDVTFSAYGPYWRQARKICVTELLSAKRVNSFRLVRDEEVTRLVDAISTRSGSEVDMSELFFSLANDTLCRVAFGKRFMEGGGEQKKSELVGVLKETQALLAGFCVVTSFLGGSGSTRKHMKQEEREESKEDFVDVLLRIQRRGDLEVAITDDNLKALVLDMFVAGTDTTSAAFEWTMTELARHPGIMRTAQDEVQKVAGSNGEVEESHLQHLHYLKAVIKETMRLHPPVPLLVPRESMEKCVLNGYEIPKGTRVLINTYAIGRDPQSWENPLEYNPDRFMYKDIDFKGQDFRFLPFGGGRRGCPGFSFALATVEIALARLLHHFEWRLPDGVGADDVDLTEIFGLATRKKSSLILVPTSKGQGFKGGDAQIS
ncbi:hypothetical protein RJ639_008547 [Escallonia herrerae]|uniref:Cytochrome P450 n=1 Tax=Escallonia herrerae TaxID=1293975 RepID=A0AA89AQL5_9ASTE|nr:hypothetical protein RJ639_008547 [Escallonia herrerae]